MLKEIKMNAIDRTNTKLTYFSMQFFLSLYFYVNDDFHQNASVPIIFL